MAMDPTQANLGQRTDNLNTNLSHDTKLYDPTQQDDQIVAMYDTRAEADAARQAVMSHDPSARAEVVDRTADGANAGVNSEGGNTGFWGSLKGLFAPDEEVHGYAEGVRRGHALLVIHPTPGTRETIIDAIEATNPVDFDAKLEQWRSAGWNNIQADRASSNANLTSDVATDTDLTSVAAGTRPKPAPGIASKSSAVAPSSQPMATGVDDGKISVVEERLRVGKRDVDRGSVRVRAYVAERPVEEKVTLHDESITLNRRPVNRPLENGASAFREQTIEVVAHGDEAVVAKEARVVEEIDVHKQVADRTETVRDTVRHTEVEIDDQRAETVKPTTPRI